MITKELIDEFESEHGCPSIVEYNFDRGVYVHKGNKPSINRLHIMQQFGLEVWLKQREKIEGMTLVPTRYIECLRRNQRDPSRHVSYMGIKDNGVVRDAIGQILEASDD